MTSPILLVGAGGLGLELAAALLLPGLKEQFTLRGFIDDHYPVGEVVNGIPIFGGLDWLTSQKNAVLFVAIGNGAVRKKIVEKLSGNIFPAIVHPKANKS